LTFIVSFETEYAATLDAAPTLVGITLPGAAWAAAGSTAAASATARTVKLRLMRMARPLWAIADLAFPDISDLSYKLTRSLSHEQCTRSSPLDRIQA
jgi:hypothetical protein